MCEKDLEWKVESQKALLHTPVFDVTEQHEVAPNGVEGDYIAMTAPDWVQTVAVHEGQFVLVRQWRHASQTVSLEFPGGVADAGEDPAESARRELLEETGFKAGRLTHLGSVSPNPALFCNRFHVYLAEELEQTGAQSLDDDELLTYELMPIERVVAAYGTGEFSHALMGTALMLYLQYNMKQ